MCSWEFPLASAAWVLCGVPAETPGLVFSPQALLAVKSVPLDEDPETEVPTHAGDGAPQPGNSKVSGCPGALPAGELVVAASWVGALEATGASMRSGAWQGGQKYLSCVFGGSSRRRRRDASRAPQEASGVDIWPNVLGASPQL